MQVELRPWPQAVRRRFTPRARLAGVRPWSTLERLRFAGMSEALRVADQQALLRCSGLTGTWTEMIFSNRADYSALASFTSEASLLAGVNEQPVLPALFFDGTRAFGRTVSLLARGVLSTTGTPSYTFTVRFGTTSGSSFLSGAGSTVVGVSAAITTASGVTNKWFELRLDLTCNTPGIGSGNTTLSGAGYVTSPGGFASPFIYPLEPTTPDTATWTATLDNSATQYVNVSVTSSASSASNTLTLKQLFLLGWN